VRAILLLVAMTLAACAHPPQPIDGQFPPVQVTDVQRGQHAGERVRWGGVIVETRPEQDRTCFELVSLPLDGRARPVPTATTVPCPFDARPAIPVPPARARPGSPRRTLA